MPDFRYKSIDDGGKNVEGLATASDEQSLATLLQDQGLTLVDAELVTGDSESAARSSGTASGSTKVPRKDLVRFTYNFHAIVSAGVPMVKGLESLADEAEVSESPLAGVLRGVISHLKSGDPLSEAMALYPRAFPSVYVNLVAAAEVSGNMETILFNLAEYLEWQEEIRGNVKQATVYPAVVLTAVAGLMALIFGVVLPQFTGIFTKLEMELPTPAKILMAIQYVFEHYWWAFLLSIPFTIFGFAMMARFEEGRRWLGWLKVRIPLFGHVIMKINVARFAKNMSLLTNAGITLNEALLITEKIADLPQLSEGIHQTSERIQRGERLAEALAHSEIFPLLVRNMVAVGEESGKLSESLNRISTFYEREIKMSLKRAFAILEPTITVFLAAIVGGVAMAVLSTMYKAITLVAK